MLSFGVGCVLAGRSIDRFGPRWTYTGGLAAIAIVFLSAGNFQMLWHFVLCTGIVVGASAALICMVSDSNVRDADGVKASALPVWCTGAAALASVASLSDGDLQVPIGCGGVAVIPGDWVVCDNDGVVVVPQALASVADQVAHLQAESQVALSDMERTLLELPTEQRKVLMLVGVEGHSYKGTADILELPVGTVMSWLSRGRLAIAKAHAA